MSTESFDPRHIVRVLLMRWRVVAVCMRQQLRQRREARKPAKISTL